MSVLIKYIFDKENLKTNGLIIILILVLYGGFKILTNHFHDTDAVIRGNTEAYLQQAISNERLTGSIDKLGKIIEQKIR